MSTANIVNKGWESTETYFVTFSVHNGGGERTYYYDSRFGILIEGGADPSSFPSKGNDGGGAGGSGIRVARAFKRAKEELDASVEAAGTDVSALRAAGATFDEAVSGLSAEALEAAGAAGLL